MEEKEILQEKEETLNTQAEQSTDPDEVKAIEIEESSETDMEQAATPTEAVNITEAPKKTSCLKKINKKKVGIIGGVLGAVIIVLFLILIPTKFEKVANECVHLAGTISGDKKNCFTLDTNPFNQDYDELEYWQQISFANYYEGALEAIEYANEELGFSGAVYQRMIKTTSMMGVQSAETDKYQVYWTYHPDSGLEATYEVK